MERPKTTSRPRGETCTPCDAGESSRRRIGHLFLVVLFASVVLDGTATRAQIPARAQAQAQAPAKEPAGTQVEPRPPSRLRRFHNAMWGKPSPSAVYPEMWTLHLSHARDGLIRNHVYGLNIRGWYAGTFINSFGIRSWAVGAQRDWFTRHPADQWTYSLGYRLGVMWGYDERLMTLAGRWPVIPAAQLRFDVEWKRVGVEANYSWVVTTFGLYVRLGKAR